MLLSHLRPVLQDRHVFVLHAHGAHQLHVLGLQFAAQGVELAGARGGGAAGGGLPAG